MVKRFNITVLMLIIATSLLTTFAHSHEHSNDEQTFEKLRAFVNKQMAEQAVPGVAIGVYHKGKFSTANFGPLAGVLFSVLVVSTPTKKILRQ